MVPALSRSASTLAKPNLLLTFDAFGTLFSPKDTVAHQYVQEARQYGLTGFSEEELAPKLMAAFKEEMKLNPNYGRATGLGATEWWTNIIHKTFTPFLRGSAALPSALFPRLIERFASKEAYDAEPSIVSSLRSLRQEAASSRRKYDKIVIGVVTNSDDRVPSILSSFGFNVSPLRYGDELAEGTTSGDGQHYDIDFHCMSYDVGVEKPDPKMYKSAELMLSRIIAAREGKEPSAAELARWRRIHIGDEYAKDVAGARDTGWDAVLLDVKGERDDAVSLEDCSQQGIGYVFRQQPLVRVGSIATLAAWLTGQET